MTTLPHPDILDHQHQVKQITRGGRQVADTAAMEKMFDALTAGKSKEEANKIFSQTYIQAICTSKETSVAS